MAIPFDSIWALNSSFVLIAAAVLFSMLLALLAYQRNINNRREQQLQHAARLLQNLQPQAGLESNLNHILGVLGTIIDANTYSFYVLDRKKQTYLLKAVRYRKEEGGQVGPSYSGLTPYRKETYVPPHSLPAAAALKTNGLIRHGEVPLWQIPLRGEQGVIRIGPVSTVPKPVRFMLDHIGELLPQILFILREADELKFQSDVAVTSEKALQSVFSMAINSEELLQKTFRMFNSSLGISGLFVLVLQDESAYVKAVMGWPREKVLRISKEREFLEDLLVAMGREELIVLRRGDERFDLTGLDILAHETELLIVSKLQVQGNEALLFSRLDPLSDSEFTMHQILTIIRSLSEQLSRLMLLQESIKPLSVSYIGLLKMLSRTIDSMNPFTVGYSELMSRYAIVMAQELGLSKKETQDVALAAYLSNIGVFGLSEALYLKEGKFSEIEFEKMKLHADVGAAIVEMTIGNKEVASYIRYHHERMDGFGYPEGLAGEEIPLGARILAVAQTFLAKINGRKYRDPLPFDKAIELLLSASGSQLDRMVVDALVRWLKRKQSGLSISKQSLGPCWEMCCTPSEICSTCPAYGNTQKNCWEQEQNNCQAHGKQCKTCFVYTEYATRKSDAV